MAIFDGQQTVTIKKPHFKWGFPNEQQIMALLAYIKDTQPMSIYGDSGIYKLLEQEIEQAFGVKYAILTNSGTSALSSAYFGINLSRGDEVIVPVYTFLATVTPLLRLGTVPVFVDADPETGNINANEIERHISKKTRAIVVTHMWGLPCAMDKIVKIANKYKLLLVEDCAHAHFTTFSEKLVGTFGIAGCFSMGAKKTWTSGEGGFLITNDPEVYIRASLLGHFNLRAIEAIKRIKEEGHTHIAKKYSRFVSGYGENYRMHPYSAVMAYAALKKTLRRDIKLRAKSLRYFVKKLKKIVGIKPPTVTEDYFRGAMYGFKPKLLLEELGYKGPIEKVIEAIKAEGVEIKLPDTLPLCDDPLFFSKSNYLNTSKRRIILDSNYPGAKEYMRGRVSLPTFSRGVLDKKIINQYCKALQKVLQSLGSL